VSRGRSTENATGKLGSTTDMIICSSLFFAPPCMIARYLLPLLLPSQSRRSAWGDHWSNLNSSFARPETRRCSATMKRQSLMRPRGRINLLVKRHSLTFCNRPGNKVTVRTKLRVSDKIRLRLMQDSAISTRDSQIIFLLPCHRCLSNARMHFHRIMEIEQNS